MAANNAENLLMVADTDHDADMLYAVGMFVPDPFIYLRIKGKPQIVMSDLEIDRARKVASHCKVTSLSQVQGKLKKAGINKPGFADIIKLLLSEKKLRSVHVPSQFPHGLAAELAERKINVKPVQGAAFPEREFKSADEVKKITEGLRAAEAGLAAGVAVLREATIGKGGRLQWGGSTLTSERLRAVIDGQALAHGAIAMHTIVAGGDQGCDPHEAGYGPLKAHQPIIIDVFPRNNKTGYFGDLTRTVVKGKASDAVRKLYATVHDSQMAALKAMGPGVNSRSVHQVVQAVFKEAGYKTERKNGSWQGFFHGTGHGLGLEIHEAPRMGATSEGDLKVGQVITVEPGLYYPGIGGVRLEDVALVTEKGVRNLTRIEKVLEV